MIDERVVEMKFDNKNFESNVQTSMSTIEKLKQALKFDGVSDGLEHINSAAGKVDMGGLGSAVESVQMKFSALQIAGITALTNITNSAVDAGKKLVASLSTDQIVAGWDKYADKTTAVQTIMAATAKDFSDTGEQMEYVESQLEKLNWFTDETSYNFIEMTNNIGKFTNNNIKLEDAVTSMQGISTWAALAGANSNEASRAMYNLSQAIGVGSVKLMDWRSIENANMATAEFKKTAMETAVELGVLSDSFEILEPASKYAGDLNVSIENFSSTLAGGWFNKDVLTATLNKYGEFTNRLYNATEAFGDQYDTVSELLEALDEYSNGTLDLTEIVENTGMTAKEVTDIFDSLASSEMALGRKGFAAAQEAKTFAEALNSVKDAVSTGWLNTFEIIFGNYQEAKKLWTRVANELWDVFAGGGKARNDILKEWKELGGRTTLFEGVETAWNNLLHIINTIKEAFREIFPEITGKRLLEITEKFKALTENFKMGKQTTEDFKNTFKGLFAVIDIVKQIVSALFNGLKSLLGFVPGMSKGILGLTGDFGSWLVALDETLKKNETFSKAVGKVVTFLQGVGKKIGDVFSEIKWLFTDDSWVKQGDIFNKKIEESGHKLEWLKPIIQSIVNFIKGIPRQISVLTDAIKWLFDGDSLKTPLRIIQKIQLEGGDVEKITHKLETLKSVIQGIINFFKEIPSKIKAVIDELKWLFDGEEFIDRSWVKQGDELNKKIDEVGRKLGWLKPIIQSVVNFFKEIPSKIKAVIDELKWLFDGEALRDMSWVKQGDEINKKIEDTKHALAGIKPAVQAVVEFVQTAFKNIVDFFKNFPEHITNAYNAVNGFVASISGLTIPDIFNNIIDFFVHIPEHVTNAYNAVNDFITNISGLTIPDIFDNIKNSLASITDRFKGIKEQTSDIGDDSKIVTLTGSLHSLSNAALSAKNASFLVRDDFSVTTQSADDLGQKVGPLTGIFKGLKKIFDAVVKAFDKAKPVFTAIGDSLGKALSDAGDAINNWADNFDFGKLAALIGTGLFTAIGIGISKFFMGIGDASMGVGGIVKSLEDIFGGFSDTLEAFQKNINAKTLSTIAHAVVELAAAIVVLSFLPSDKMAIASGAIAALVGEMIGAMAVVGKMDTVMDTAKLKLIGKTLISVSTAVLILAAAVKSLSDIPLLDMSNGSGLVAGLGVITGLLGEIVIFSYIINNKDFEDTAKALVILSAGLFVMGQTIKNIAELSWDQLAVGLTGFAVALAGIIVATKFVDEKTTKVSLGLGLMALALRGVADVVKVFAAMDINSLIIGMTAMAAALLVMALAANGMANPMVLEGAGAMVIMAAALLLLIPVIQTLGGMKIEELGMALLGLVGVFTVLGVAGLVLGPVVPVIAALAAAIAILGVGMAAAGVGMLAFSTGLATLSVAGAAGITLLSAAILAIVALIPNILLAVGDGIVKLVKFFGDAAPVFKDAFVKIVTAMVQGFTETIPAVVKAVVTMIDELLKTIAEHLPSIIESGWQMVLALLHGIEDHIQEAVETFIGIITGIINGIANKMPDIIESGINLILSFIEGLSKGIVDNAERARDAMRGLIESLIEAMLIVLGIAKDKDEAKEMVKTAEDAISSFITGLWNKAKDLFNAAVKVVTDAWDGIVNTVKDWIKAGEDLINGLWKGITDTADTVIKGITGLATDVWNGFCDFFGIHSPSTKMAQAGKYIDEGLAKGIDDNADVPIKSAESMGDGIFSRISSSLAKIKESLNKDLDGDFNPVVNPVIDLDDFKNGVKKMNRMIDPLQGDVINKKVNLTTSNRSKEINPALSIDLAKSDASIINTNIADRNTSGSVKDLIKSSTTNNEITNNFNITGDNPKAIAGEISRLLQTQLERKDASWA